ncbi:tetratricopeptide repeat protein [Fodinibius sp. Rm-B-1B1-1]|uniref:tetratricopeptide repeat protein n=1 Tax=Fodinibius alkaliphilus TaxID=3140241 RepID=UPI003159D8C8
MPQLPFKIPKSLASYAEHFDKEPIEATKRLKKQLKKRGPDAVGHFLLAWFYHLEGMDDQAVDEALKARIFAPGSPFFEKLHYYLSHPNTLEAWTPESTSASTKTSSTIDEPGPVLNLDSLIEKLSSVESKRIRPQKEEETQTKSKKQMPGDNVDDIVSETLAQIHERQGKFSAAINTYEQLINLHPNKKDHYNEEIARLKALREENEGE